MEEDTLKFIKNENLILGKKICPQILSAVEAMATLKGHIEEPIIVDFKSNVILKGNHLFTMLKEKGHKEIPTIYSDYLSDKFMIISGSDREIRKEDYLQNAINKNPYDSSECLNIYLSEPQKIYYKTNNAEIEVKNNKKNRASKNQPAIDKIQKFIENQITLQTDKIYHLKKELKKIELAREKISDSLKVGFFPGKFHPPHMGHIQTILELVKQYKKVIIGISQDLPKTNKMTTPEQIMQTLVELFKDNDKIEITMLDGVLVDKENTAGLPDFDILLSGNPEVLKWCKKMNIKNEFVSRSHGNLSSTLIRSGLSDEQ